MGVFVERLGFALLILGGACIGGIFLIVIVNGSWPYYLEPVRSRFKLAHQLLGPFSYIVTLGVFLVPGWLLIQIGDAMNSSRKK